MTDTLADLTFEAAYTELTDIIERMETGELALDEAVALFERGRELTAHCDQLLEKAELRIDKLNSNGTIENIG